MPVNPKSLDRIAIKKYGIPAIILMENAGRGVAEEVLKFKPKSVAVVCGKGNNGGDGFVAARHLFNHGTRVRVFYLGKPSTPEAFLNFNIIRKMKVSLKPFVAPPRGNYDLIVDAILGTGLRRPLKGIYAQAVDWIRNSHRPVISVDVPSSSSLSPVLTVALGFRKDHPGKTVVKDISLPRQLLH